MTLDDAKKLKSELEANVLKLFQEFEAKTGCRISMAFDYERDYKEANKPLLSVLLSSSM